MREILFRGKAGIEIGQACEVWEIAVLENGNWIQGDLIWNNGIPFIVHGVIEANDEYISLEWWMPVDPATVGQFTGLYDKNGVKIFEGDILRFPAKDEYEKTTFVGYEVFYHDNDCADNHIGFQMNRMRFYGHLCGGECRAKLLPKYTSQMVIVGNIHDQKEDV